MFLNSPVISMNALLDPKSFFKLIALVSILSLAGAFTAELVFGLEPCVLCIYQRWPFVAAILLAVVGRYSGFTAIAAAFLSLNFLGNAAIAFYHSGVERKWWASVFEGCAVPDLGTDPATLLENIMNAPTARCDEIPWADPLIGLSMANYNALLCLGLALLCAIFVVFRKTSQT